MLWNALKRTCMAIGAMVLFSAILGTTLSMMAMKDVSAPSLPDEMVLYLPLEKALVEHSNVAGSSYSFQEKTLTIRDAVNALDRAAKDERVKGFVTTVRGGALSLTHTDELRAAIARFRESGKFAYIYAEGYEGLGQYYLASAFEEIWLQPMGLISIPGMQVEMPYVRPALDKIGVEPQFFARKEYKNLFESFTDSEMSPESREVMSAILVDIGAAVVQGVSADRKLDSGAFQKLVDKGLFTDAEALESGLVDRLDYGDEFSGMVKELVTGDAENKDKIFVKLGRYAKEAPGGAAAGSPKVALIYAVGQIVQRDNSKGGNLAAADNLVETIRDAASDEDIGVIVLRVDSPGGSPTASETIRRAVIKAKEKGKKIVVSMGGAAASGGYWIAADADYIFASPMTFTGSIGVTGGKFSLQAMWEKVGIKWDGVSWGENSGLWSFNRPYSPSEAERMNAMMDNVYDSFVALVAGGRGMTPEQVDKVAGGRVWTGAQAKDVGLVDELGGLDMALDYTAGLVGVADRHALRVVVMPRPKTTFERVVELLDTQVRIGEFFRSNSEMFMTVTSSLKEFTSYGRPEFLAVR